MNAKTRHRLNGLEPDNLLAFLALLGLLRALQKDGQLGTVRAAWSVDQPPVRPVLHLGCPEPETSLVDSAIRGLRALAAQIDLEGRKDLRVTRTEGADLLTHARESDAGGVWSALISDAAVYRDGRLEPTPLCLMFGQGHQHFLARLASIPRLKTPPDRGKGRTKRAVSEAEALAEALFDKWQRPDPTESFRWDPKEDVRYALRANDPQRRQDKETTQHGANRLAAIALPLLTVAPQAPLGGRPRLAVRGGGRDATGQFTFSWPIWRDPISLSCACHLLNHPRLDDTEVRLALGIVEQRLATRVANGRYRNFTPGVAC